MTVNLLPPQVKRMNETKAFLNRLYLVLMSALIMLAISTLALSIANKFFIDKIAETDQKIAEFERQTAKYKELETKVRQTNIKLDFLSKADADRNLWSEIIGELASKTPINIQMKSLTLSKENQSVSLTGVAESRKNIADLKEELENSTLFKNVTFSSSTYNDQESDFSFSLSAEIEGGKNGN